MGHRRQVIALEGDLILAFVADEEYSSLGTERFLEQGHHADGAIVLEPSQEESIRKNQP